MAVSSSEDCQLSGKTKKGIKQTKKNFAKGKFYALKQVEETSSSKV